MSNKTKSESELLEEILFHIIENRKTNIKTTGNTLIVAIAVGLTAIMSIITITAIM